MIIRLGLKNFRKHENFEANFTAGLNGIFGPNYRGKTTVEYGILYALGGIRAIPCRTVLRTGASTFRVDMVFQAGDVYRVVRTKSTDRLYAGDTEEDSALIANGATVVNAKIEEIIGMSMKRFLQTRFARQKHTDAILLSGANALYAAINEISGADTVDAALKLLVDRVTKLDGYLDATVAPDVEETKQELGKAVNALAVVTAKLEAGQLKCDSTAATVQTAADLLDAANAAELANATHETNLRHAERDQERAIAGLATAQAANKAYSNVDLVLTAAEVENMGEQVTQAEERDTELNRLQRDIDNAGRSVTTYTAAANTARDNLAALVKPAGVPKGTETVENLLSTVAKLEAEFNAIQLQYENLDTQLEATCCPTCQRAWETVTEGERDRLAELKVELKANMDAKAEVHTAASKALANVRVIWNDYNTAQSKFNTGSSALQFQLDSATEGKAKAEGELATAELAIKQLKLDGNLFAVTTLREELKRLEGVVREATRCAKDIAKAQAEVDNCATALQALKGAEVVAYNFADHAELKRNHTLLKAADDQAKEQLSQIKTDLAVVENSHQYLSKLLPVQQQHLDAINEAEGKRSTAKTLQKFLKLNRDRYMADVWSVLMAEASQFASQCTSGAIECVSRTVDGDFTYTENGQEFPISEASGAQLSIMGLAMQVALSSAVQPPLDVLIVDEPNADMDPEHSMAANMLLSAAVGQVICVSHAAMDSSICQNVIEL